MKNLIYKSALFLFWIIILPKVNAQDVYITQQGDMVITANYADTVLKITTKELLILLNYDNAEITIKMDKSTLKTGIDSLDKKLILLKYDIIQFTGKLDIDYINTKSHPPVDFAVEGNISTNQQSIFGEGHLEHLTSRGTYSCLLTLKFNLKISDLGIKINGLSFEDEIQIDIIHSVLNKYQDQ